MSYIIIGSPTKFVTLSALPTGWVTMMDETVDKTVAMWTGSAFGTSGSVTNGRDTHVGPFTPTSVTSVGTVATVTLNGHKFVDNDELTTRRADGDADTVNGGYNTDAAGSGGAGITEPFVDNAAANTFTYGMHEDMLDVSPTPVPVIVWEPWLWWGSASSHLGYYDPYHSFMGYCDWLDRRSVSSTAHRAERYFPMDAELARWQYQRSPTGYSRFGAGVALAKMNGESWDGGTVSQTVVNYTWQGGAYPQGQIASYKGTGSLYVANTREWAYTLEALVSAERADSPSWTRQSGTLDLRDACINHLYMIMYETSIQYPRIANPTDDALDWTGSTAYTAGGTWTNLAVSGSGIKVITSADANFDVGMVGSTLTIESGTSNLTAGDYVVDTYDSTSQLTLLTSPATGVVTGGVGEIVHDYVWQRPHVTGSCTSNSSTKDEVIDTARTESITDYWVGSTFRWLTGSNAGEQYDIRGFNTTTDTIDFSGTGFLFTNLPVIGDTYEILAYRMKHVLADHTSPATYDLVDFVSSPWPNAEGTIQGDTPFMVAITAQSLLNFYDWETDEGRDPDATWRSTITKTSSDYSSTVANPWSGILECLQDVYEWIFNRGDYGITGPALDTSSINRDTPNNVGYMRRTHPGYLGEPMMSLDSGTIATGYRNFGTFDFTLASSQTLMGMSLPGLYWLAWRLKDTDLTAAQWIADKGDEIMTLLGDGSHDPYINMAYTGQIKEGNERIWHIADALNYRNSASNRTD